MEKSNFIKLVVGTGTVQVTGKVLTVIFGILLARNLGADDYGKYAYLLSIITLISLPVIAGLPQLILREVSNLRQKKDIGGIKNILSFSRSFIIIIGTLFFAISCLVFKYFEFDSVISFSVFSILSTLIFLRGILVRNSAIINAYEKTKLSQLPLVLIVPTVNISIFSIYYWSGRDVDVDFAIVSMAVSTVLAVLVSQVIMMNVTKLDKKIVKNKKDIRKWLVSLIPFSLLTIITTFNSELGVIFLGFFSEETSVAYFKVGAQAILIVTIGQQAINTLISPKIARLYKSGDLITTQRMLSKSVRVSCVYGLIVCGTFVFFGDFIIVNIFGREYSDAVDVVNVLLIGQAFNIMSGSVAIVLNMTGNENRTLKAQLITVIITVCVLFIIVPANGHIGAAWALTLSLIIWNSLMSYDVYKITGLKCWIFGDFWNKNEKFNL
ncbi:oligosaccharide flippase family protein [Vibrio cyclitrophicus]